MRCLLYQRASSAISKDVLPALQKSNVIYQFSCHCDSRYVGSTSQRLQDRIKHVPKSIRFCVTIMQCAYWKPCSLGMSIFVTRELLSCDNLQSGVILSRQLTCDELVKLYDSPINVSHETQHTIEVLALLPRNAYVLPVGANFPPILIPSLLLLIQLNIMAVDFQFLPKAALLSIYLLLKPLSSKLPTPISADKKISYIA